VSQFQKLIVLVVDADFPVNGADKTRIADRFALLVQATNDGGVQAILGAQRRREIALNGADNHHTSVKIGMFVKQVDLPVDKRTQEVAFTKLNDTFWVESTGKITTVECSQWGPFLISHTA
jgi:hypothetical protein